MPNPTLPLYVNLQTSPVQIYGEDGKRFDVLPFDYRRRQPDGVFVVQGEFFKQFKHPFGPLSELTPETFSESVFREAETLVGNRVGSVPVAEAPAVASAPAPDTDGTEVVPPGDPEVVDTAPAAPASPAADTTPTVEVSNKAANILSDVFDDIEEALTKDERIAITQYVAAVEAGEDAVIAPALEPYKDRLEKVVARLTAPESADENHDSADTANDADDADEDEDDASAPAPKVIATKPTIRKPKPPRK